MSALALSVQQPWLWAITDLDKRVENRSKPTKVRGEVFLHASAKPRPLSDLDCLTTPEALFAAHVDASNAMPLGAIVAVADLADCIDVAAGERWDDAQERWTEGPFGYCFRTVTKLPEPVPCKGKLGFWKVPADVEAKVREQLKAIAEQSAGGPYYRCPTKGCPMNFGIFLGRAEWNRLQRAIAALRKPAGETKRG